MQDHTRDRWCRREIGSVGATVLSESINICFIRYGNLSIKILVAFWRAKSIFCLTLSFVVVETVHAESN